MSLNGAVRNTAELARIIALPRRRLDAPEHAALVNELTDLLSVTDRCTGKPTGPYDLCDVCGAPTKLRLVQALALHDAGICEGVFGPIGVGEGKTLITLLVSYILSAKRPMLLLPAGLIEKTNRDREKLHRHWDLPNNVRLFSYEMLGRVQAAGELENYNPDLIIGDEIQKLKNLDAARTRRVVRFMDAHPETKFAAFSGTIMDRSLLEFGHILRWCLKGDAAPIPSSENEFTEWALALDEKVDELRRYDVGALLDLDDSEDEDDTVPEITRARRGFQKRLVETPGVVATSGEGESVKCSIYVKAITYKMAPITDQHLARLRSEMVTPDDWDITPVDVWRHARELAIGFHQIWDPRPPEDWRDARREWFSFVRGVLSRSDTIDSPDHVATIIDAGDLKSGEAPLEKWRAIRDTFTPNPVPVWHDDSALKVAAAWMSRKGARPGIVWTEHVPFAERLSSMTGAPYFGPRGLDASGEIFIEDADAGPIIASIDANREGLNLQWKWSRNLIVSPQESPSVWQQSIARTHRPGQSADEVDVDVFLGCLEHQNAWRKARAGAIAVRDTTGAEQKLLLADVEWPSDDDVSRFSGARWKAPPIKRFEIPIAA